MVDPIENGLLPRSFKPKKLTEKEMVEIILGKIKLMDQGQFSIRLDLLEIKEALGVTKKLKASRSSGSGTDGGLVWILNKTNTNSDAKPKKGSKVWVI